MRVLVQKWEESERGWGTRPDGYSVHRDEKALKRFVKAYWDSMPDSAPDEYSRPCGTPYWADTQCSEEAIRTTDGQRVNSNDYPIDERGGQGSDGWKGRK